MFFILYFLVLGIKKNVLLNSYDFMNYFLWNQNLKKFNDFPENCVSKYKNQNYNK